MEHFSIICLCRGSFFFSFGSYRGNTLLLGLMSYVRPSVRPSVQNASQRNPSLTDESIMRKFYTVAIYDLRMYIKEDYPGMNYFMTDS